jgi:hypothetical protein
MYFNGEQDKAERDMLDVSEVLAASNIGAAVVSKLKRRLTSTRLQGTTSQKPAIFTDCSFPAMLKDSLQRRQGR